jgi:hypothetical protein
MLGLVCSAGGVLLCTSEILVRDVISDHQSSVPRSVKVDTTSGRTLPIFAGFSGTDCV